MGTGYSRNDTSNNIDDGKIIDAADLDGEFDAIVSAFNSSTGHTHDGTSSEGAPIEVTGPAQEYLFDATAIYPKTDNTYDLGKVGAEFKDLYIDGTANIDSLVADAGTVGGVAIASLSATQTLTNKTLTSPDINGGIISGGSIDNAVVGGTTAAAGSFTTLSTSGAATLSSASVTGALSAGRIDSTPIGGTTAAAGSFTTISTTGTATLAAVSVTGPLFASRIDGTPIGSVTTASGSFTSLSASGTVSLTGTSNLATLVADESLVTKYVEEKVALSTVGATVDVDLDSGNVFSLSLVDDETITFSNPPASGTAQRFTIRITASGTRIITWPATVSWPGGTKPSDPSSGTTNIYSFFTDDGGTTYYGFLLGADMS